MKLPDKRPDAILCADLHIREDQPSCRSDDFWETQKEKLIQLSDIQNHYDTAPPILCAGDLFHKWKAPPRLLSTILEYLPDDMIVVPGNHDLPAHNLSKLEWSALMTLEKAGKIVLLTESFYKNDYGFKVFPFPYGADLKHAPKSPYAKVALVHHFTYKGRKPFPGATNGVGSFMKKLKGYDLILCGDNHQPFTHRDNDTIFVNPGSMSRQTSDQIKHKPRVYLWYSERKEVIPIYLNIDRSVVAQSQYKIAQEYNKRIEVFVSKLNKNVEISLDFVQNLKRHTEAHKISQPVYFKIMEAVDGD